MNSHARTLARQAEWTPRSGASTPAAIPPHPPLQSGGWYHGVDSEPIGPGRPSVDTTTKSPVRSAIAIVALFGLLALLLLIF